MKVSTRGDYASRALLSLTLHGAQTTPTSVRDIAERTGLPQPYLEQILLALKGAGLVRSKRGVGGGYVLAREPEHITLAQIVSAVDGPIVAGDFGEPHTGGACDHEGQCILLAVWAEVGETIRQYLQTFTLADMATRSRGGSAGPPGLPPLDVAPGGVPLSGLPLGGAAPLRAPLREAPGGVVPAGVVPAGVVPGEVVPAGGAPPLNVGAARSSRR